MEKEKRETIEAFLEGDISLSEALETEDKCLWDFDLGIPGSIEVNCTPINNEYEFYINWYDKEFGVTDDDVGAYVETMEEMGFEDAGMTGGCPIESEVFICQKCKKEYNPSDVSDEEWEKLWDTEKCPECGGKLVYECVYEHVHLEGSKTVKIPKTEIKKLIKESKTIMDFTAKLLEKLGFEEVTLR